MILKFLKINMKKIIIAISIFIILLLIVFYFIATNKAYDMNFYFTPKSATQNWGIKSDEVLFEFLDNNFYVAFDNNNIKSSRKDFCVWVRNKFDSFFDDSTSEIYTVTIKDYVYVYGIVRGKDAKKVKLVDFTLNEVKSEFKSSFITDLNLLCFCVKINKKQLLLEPYSVKITDVNDCVISLENTPKKDKKTLLVAEEILKSRPQTDIFDISEDTYSKKIKLKTNEQLYLVLDDDEYVLQNHKEFVEFYFYDDYVLLNKKLNIFTAQNFAKSKTKSKSYSETYRVKYTDELNSLRQSAD